MSKPRWTVVTNCDPNLNDEGLDLNEKVSKMLQVFKALSDKGFKVVLATATLGLEGSVTITDEEALNGQDIQGS